MFIGKVVRYKYNGTPPLIIDRGRVSELDDLNQFWLQHFSKQQKPMILLAYALFDNYDRYTDDSTRSYNYMVSNYNLGQLDKTFLRSKIVPIKNTLHSAYILVNENTKDAYLEIIHNSKLNIGKAIKLSGVPCNGSID